MHPRGRPWECQRKEGVFPYRGPSGCCRDMDVLGRPRMGSKGRSARSSSGGHVYLHLAHAVRQGPAVAVENRRGHTLKETQASRGKPQETKEVQHLDRSRNTNAHVCSVTTCPVVRHQRAADVARPIAALHVPVPRQNSAENEFALRKRQGTFTLEILNSGQAVPDLASPRLGASDATDQVAMRV